MDFNKPQKNNKNNNNNKINKEKKLKENPKLEITESQFGEDDLEYYDYIVELPLFPIDFHVHKGTKRVTDDEINDWIEELIITLESNKDEQFATAQAEGTKIVILRVHDSEDSYHYIIEVFKERYSAEIYPEEL